MADTVALLSRGLSQMTTVLEQVPTDSLDAATPCRDWTVRELLRHVVRQNLRNFAASARGDNPDWSATPPELGVNWVEDYRHGAEHAAGDLACRRPGRTGSGTGRRPGAACAAGRTIRSLSSVSMPGI